MLQELLTRLGPLHTPLGLLAPLRLTPRCFLIAMTFVLHALVVALLYQCVDAGINNFTLRDVSVQSCAYWSFVYQLEPPTTNSVCTRIIAVFGVAFTIHREAAEAEGVVERLEPTGFRTLNRRATLCSVAAIFR